VSLQRVGAVMQKEAREFRRNRFVISTMAVLPIVFLITPLITLFRVPASAGGTEVERAVGVMSLLLLIVPIVIPPVIAAYSVVGERDQGTLDRPRRTETPRVGLEPPRGRVGPTLVQGGSYGTRTSRDLRRGQQ